MSGTTRGGLFWHSLHKESGDETSVYIVDVRPALVSLNRLDVGSVADVSELHTTYIFRVEVRECLCIVYIGFSLTDPRREGRGPTFTRCKDPRAVLTSTINHLHSVKSVMTFISTVRLISESSSALVSVVSSDSEIRLELWLLRRGIGQKQDFYLHRTVQHRELSASIPRAGSESATSYR
jgi:hypothetical protein